MPVEQQRRAGRRHARRNVYEHNRESFQLEGQRQRPVEAVVAIAAHNFDRRPDLGNRVQQRRHTHVSKVPYFIGSRDRRGDIRGKPIVCIGKDGDAHNLKSFEFVARFAGLPIIQRWQEYADKP